MITCYGGRHEILLVSNFRRLQIQTKRATWTSPFFHYSISHDCSWRVTRCNQEITKTNMNGSYLGISCRYSKQNCLHITQKLKIATKHSETFYLLLFEEITLRKWLPTALSTKTFSDITFAFSQVLWLMLERLILKVKFKVFFLMRSFKYLIFLVWSIPDEPKLSSNSSNVDQKNNSCSKICR